MAYKKYIEKNGKIYGPYIYHSKRVNGKVVSEYRGTKGRQNKFKKVPREVKSRRILIFLVGILMIIALTFWILFFQAQFSGRVVLDIQDAGVEGGLVSGNINLLIQGGELIPKDSIITIENGNKSYDYFLSELIEEESISGNFYLEGVDLFGGGEGYGFVGEQEEILPIFFQFELIKKDISNGGGSSGEEISEPIESEESPEEIGELKPVEETNESVGEPVESEESPEEIGEPGVSEPIEEETIEEVPEEIPEEIPEEVVEEEEVIEEPESEPPPSITGNIARSIGGIFSGSFTGRLIDDNLIQGDVEKGEEFRYNIPSGTKVKIVENSVRSEEEDLDLDVLEVLIEGDELIITTDYSKIETGFGENYLGEENKVFSILLSNLNIEFVPGPILVKGVYGELELFSIEGEISEEFIEQIEESINDSDEVRKLIENITLGNETVELINETINETIEVVGLVLTKEEKNILKEFFGMAVVETSAKTYRDKILVEFNIGDYALEHYYSDSLSEEDLIDAIEQDRISWLKDLAREFSREKDVSEDILELKEIYPIL